MMESVKHFRDNVLRYLRTSRLVYQFLDDHDEIEFNKTVFEYIQAELFTPLSINSDIIFVRSLNKKSEIFRKENQCVIVYDRYFSETIFDLLENYHYDGYVTIGFKHISEYFFRIGDIIRSNYWGNVYLELAKLTRFKFDLSPISYLKRPFVETFILFHEATHCLYEIRQDDRLSKKAEDFINNEFVHTNLFEQVIEQNPDLKLYIPENVIERNLISKSKFLDQLVTEMVCDANAVEETYKFFKSKEKTFLLRDFNISILSVLANIRWIGNLNYYLQDGTNFGSDFIHNIVRQHWGRAVLSEMHAKYPEIRLYYRPSTGEWVNNFNEIAVRAKEYLIYIFDDYESLDEAFRKNVYAQDTKIDVQDIIQW